VGSATTINFSGINVTGIITATDGFMSSNTTINSSGIDVITGIITATDGFVSTANTTPIQIQLVGNLLTFNAVGIGSTTFTLF
jgi:fructose-1,6-bisphosphatase/sedoheptulose 1,7-bisphosphatase-like protein